MASPTSYPKVPVKAWTALRTRATNAPTTKFTPGTVAALLDMSSPRSAADNIVYPLRKLGLIDDDGALTARGNKWRVDASYPEACQEILDAVYPDDLAALTSDDGSPDKVRITTWLQHQGLGDSNAKQMAATYAMIATKSPPDPAAPESKATRPAKKAASVAPAKKAPKQEEKVEQPKDEKREEVKEQRSSGPNVHLDIQIHIPAEATADQIDQIFASMARHLYSK